MEKYSGLTKEEVLKNKKEFGNNSLSSSKRNTFLSLLIDSLKDPIIKILLIVLVVKVVFLFSDFDWFETLGIVIAILLASIISAISEYGSEKAFNKLQDESSHQNCTVIIDKQEKKVLIEEVVKNDLVMLSSGDIVPADGVIIDGNVYVDESSFTGESKDIEKRKNDEIYRGTSVLKGKAIIKITNVGFNTKYGNIAKELLKKTPDSPLKIRLKHLAGIISKVGIIGAILVMFSYLFSVIVINNDFNITKILNFISNPKIIFEHILYALTLTVTIIIVSVPEGLPMMVALVLSSNMKRMIKENVLVRKIVGIETAGCMNTLFFDKTGTITKGNLELRGIVQTDGNKITNLEEAYISKEYKKLLIESLIINNEAKIDEYGNIIDGNMTDKALLSFAKNYKINVKTMKFIPFDSEKKYSSAYIDDGKIHTLIKGAPEVLEKFITKCYINDKLVPYNKEDTNKLLKKYTSLGYRVIYLCDSYSRNNLYLIGMALLKDEIKDNVKETIAIIKDAGIDIKMITGDSKETAIKIGKEIGLLNNESIVLTSNELKMLSDEKLKSIFKNIKIIARALPSDKTKLVKLAQEKNLVVGMTGDGVNDSPALKLADVGFSMGSGSEVAKEASDIVLLDNNLSSISSAILYGRTIFKSIRKFVVFQLTMNLCALTLSILGPFLNINTPITVMQMLWINMIMDTFAGLAFSYEAPIKDYMKEKPLNKKTPIINKYMYSSILITGVYTAIMLITFLKANLFGSNKTLMTAFFGLFVLSGIVNSFNTRTSRINILSNINKNKPFLFIISFILVVQIILLYKGGNVFRTYGLTIKELLIILFLSLTPIIIDTLRKIGLKKAGKNTGY